MGITVAMVDMATLEDTMVPVMDQDTTLDMGMVMTTGDTQVLTRLGRADQHTGLPVTHGPRMFHVLLVLLESQARPRVARPRVARPRVARQHEVKNGHNKLVTHFLPELFACLKNLDWFSKPLHPHEYVSKS